MKKMSFVKRNVLFPHGLRPLPVIVVVLVVAVLLLRVTAPGWFVTLVSPLWRASSLASGAVADVSALAKNPGTLTRELADARAENAALLNTNATLAGQVEELQKLLGARTTPVPGMLASVLTRPPMSPYDTLVVDEGEESGVSVGVVVTGPGGAPLGTVSTVMRNSARITLYSSPGIETLAWVGKERIPVTLSGVGGGAFETNAPRDADISVGDAVYVGGAVSIGGVVRVDRDPSSPIATLRIQAAINPFSLMWVVIARAS